MTSGFVSNQKKEKPPENGKHIEYRHGWFFKKKYKSSNYIDGKLDGVQKFYDRKGKIFQVINWKNGKQHGSEITYDSDWGVPQFIHNYKNGKKHGEQISYDYKRKIDHSTNKIKTEQLIGSINYYNDGFKEKMCLYADEQVPKGNGQGYKWVNNVWFELEYFDPLKFKIGKKTYSEELTFEKNMFMAFTPHGKYKYFNRENWNVEEEGIWCNGNNVGDYFKYDKNGKIILHLIFDFDGEIKKEVYVDKSIDKISISSWSI